MNGRQSYRVIQAVLIGIFLISVQTRLAQAKSDSSLFARVDNAQILQASLQIIMSLELDQPAGSSGAQQVVYSIGLGSLIEKQGEVFIVTHNHRGEILQNFTAVEFRDARNGLLLRMLGFQFKKLIRFQDAGTLVLKAPGEIDSSLSKSSSGAALKPAIIGDGSQLKPGDIVQVAYRQSGNREQLAVLDAEVLSLSSYLGLPTFNLRSLTGQPITPGDSGGGVFYNGKLVGNSWMTVMNQVVSSGDLETKSPVQTDRSFAALLPDL
jgi:hypothetical protein